jgi:hypothetical protein
MSNCIPCPPCEDQEPLVCEPYGAVTSANRVLVEDDAFCTKSLQTPTQKSNLVWDGKVKWVADDGNLGNWKTITQNYVAVNGDKLSVNTTSGSLQVTLPQNPPQYAEIVIADHYGSWATNNVFVIRNGSLIENVADNLTLNTSWPNQITLRFEGATWRVFSII